jgi:hypothetical protein
MGPSVYETTQDLLVEAAHGAVLSAAGAAREGTEATGLALRTGAALYSLLHAHAVDRRGRCRWCRRSWWSRRGPTCTVYARAYYWLHQPLDVLITHLIDLGIDLPDPGAPEPDPDATRAMIPILSPRPSAGPPTEPIPPLRAVAPDSSATGRPDPDHGGAGADPDLPWPRRDPPEDDPTIAPHQGLLVRKGPTPCWN